MPKTSSLTRREHQVMNAIHELQEATAKEIQQRLPDPPSYSAVRAVLSRLVEQGHLKYREIGPRYVYVAAVSKKKVRVAELRRLMNRFFDGSPLHTMNALLGLSAEQLSKKELDELAALIARAAEKADD
jgi:predicted transcriptional regulator